MYLRGEIFLRKKLMPRNSRRGNQYLITGPLWVGLSSVTFWVAVAFAFTPAAGIKKKKKLERKLFFRDR